MLAAKFQNQVLVLVSIQLGMKKIQAEYFDTIHQLMNLTQFVGAVGGRPNLAYFFVGTLTKHKLIYLDPHKVESKVFNLDKEY